MGSNKEIGPFAGLTMVPEERELAQAIFGEIVHRPWFHRSEVNDVELAEIILRAYRDGKNVGGQMLNYCELVAKLRFSR